MIILRIIGDVGYSLASGPARQAYLLTKGLAQRGIYSTILTFKAGQFDGIHEIDVKVFKPVIEIGHYKLSLSMLKHALNTEATLIHVHGYRNFQTEAGSFASTIKGKPLVMTAHGTISGFMFGEWGPSGTIMNRLYDLMTMKYSLRRADAIVATCKAEAKELIEFGIPESKISIIPHGMDMPVKPKPIPITSREATMILTVSRLTYKNNLELAIRGFAKAVKEKPDMRYIIVGDEKPSRYVPQEKGYKTRLLELCKRLRVEDKVIFTGWLTGDRLWQMYNNADIFIWTSYYDNFGHALVEAAHFGLPIISTPVGVAPEIIDGEEGEFLIPHDDVDALARAIVHLADNLLLRRRIGEHNRGKAKNYFVERMVNGYLSLYEHLVK